MARSESCDKAEEGRGWAEPHLCFLFLANVDMYGFSPVKRDRCICNACGRTKVAGLSWIRTRMHRHRLRIG